MKKNHVCLLLLVLLSFGGRPIKGEIQLALSDAIMGHEYDVFLILGIGPIMKNHIKNEWYLNTKIGPSRGRNLDEQIYDPGYMSIENVLVTKRGEKFAIGGIIGTYRISKVNFLFSEKDNREMDYLTSMYSGGFGFLLRYFTNADFYCIAKGTVSGSFYSSTYFPIEMNAQQKDIDHYDSSRGYKETIYKEEYLNRLDDYEEEYSKYSLPLICSISAQKYLNRFFYAIGFETVLMPYIYKNNTRCGGVYYKISGYFTMGIRLWKNKNNSLPYLF